MNKNLHLYLLSAILIVTAFFAGAHSERSDLVTVPSTDKVKASECCEDLPLEHFSKVWESIQQSYVGIDGVDRAALEDGAIKGLVSALGDPHSDYYTAEESEEFLSSLDSELEGIGAELNEEDGRIVVVTPLKGSPAKAAGLMIGDQIVAVDGEEVIGEDMFEVISKIRGEKGTKVVLTIFREGEDDLLEIVITRDTIEIESVRMIDLEDAPEIAYMRINQFSNDTEKEFVEAINQILIDAPRGMIIDLRYNGGGYLQTAIGVLGELLEPGTRIVNIEEGGARLESEIFTEGQSRLTEIPLVVLVNEGSASASEILAGAVKDTGRGIIIGTQTYGKGTVQELQPFGNGSTLRITVSKWLTPNGTDIDHKGITPDVSVEFTEEDIEAEIDTQLERAKEYLKSL